MPAGFINSGCLAEEVWEFFLYTWLKNYLGLTVPLLALASMFAGLAGSKWSNTELWLALFCLDELLSTFLDHF